ncbi:MAG: hypothetical protein KBT88_12460 [Gammaproteobacteria bacterium]|nr:hypothetical protein [Gammaproteobacteria bacterium]MBQ0840588.1 hypothetical protein [Gammaproteobacteria bacterium]
MNFEHSSTQTLAEQAAVVYGLYETRARTFKRTFAAVAMLMTVVFGLVYWPYTNFRGTEYKLVEELEHYDRQLSAERRMHDEFGEQLERLSDAERRRYEAISLVLESLDRQKGDPQAYKREVDRALSELEAMPREFRIGHASHIRNDMVRLVHPIAAEAVTAFKKWHYQQGGHWLSNSLISQRCGHIQEFDRGFKDFFEFAGCYHRIIQTWLNEQGDVQAVLKKQY